MTLGGLVTPRVVAPAAHSLTKTVGVIEHAVGDMRWAGKLDYDPLSFRDGGIADPCDASGLTSTTVSCGDTTVGGFATFLVYQPLSISTEQRLSDENWEDRVRRSLLISQSSLIARELWLGANSDAQGTNNKRLASETWTDNYESGDPTGPVESLAALEQMNGSRFFGTGLIHCTRETFTYWDSFGLIRDAGNGLATTKLSTPVVADPGYTVGYDEDGETPTDGERWAYLSGPMDIHLGPIDVIVDETQARLNNVVTLIAVRYAGLVWAEEKNHAVNVKSCNTSENCV